MKEFKHLEIINSVIEYIKKNSLVKAKEPLILAISGGPDSIFILHLAVELRRIMKNTIYVAHFNHKLRDEADEEQVFVENLAKELGCRFVFEAKDVKAAYDGNSLEQTARRLRYDFFEKLSREFKAKKILFGHHKDDLAETVLMRIVRGSGLMGLKAMQPISKYKRMQLVRPLLQLEKKEILKFLDSNNLKYMLDASNEEDIFLRNKIRKDFIPQLEELNPSIKNALLNLTTTLAYDYDYMHSQVLEHYKNILKSHNANRLRIDLHEFKQMHPAIQNHLLRHCLQEVRGHLRRIELRHCYEIMDLVNNRPVRSIVDLPDCQAIKEKDELVFKRAL